MTKITTPVLLSAMTGLCFLATACSPSTSSLVTGATVSSETQNGDIYVLATVDLNTYNLTLPSFSLPISLNGVPDAGSVGMAATSGSAQLEMSIDLTEALKVGASGNGGLLPNGTPIPIVNLNGVPVLVIPVNSSGLEVYVSLSTTNAMLGAAIPIPQFASIGKSLGGLNFFPSFTIGSVNGVAGIYTSNISADNGLAVFVDTALAAKKAVVKEQAVASGSTTQLKFAGAKPAAHVQSQMEDKLYEIGNERNGRPLTLE